MFLGNKRSLRKNKRPAPTREPRLLAALLPEFGAIEFRVLGRTFTQSALVGLLAGLFGVGFFLSLELVQSLVLERLAGYTPLRANGERLVEGAGHHVFQPWLIVILPAIGALASGIITTLAPDARGGGGNAMIRCFHQQGGATSPRVIWVKALASIFTLGFGGAGGREGPTMQIGGALGTLVGGWLGANKRELRILMVAGVAAGISAVFRTPLGAALFAIEVLYRDDFEAEALVPAVLASVVSYSVVISLLGESTLFSHPPHYAFIPAHLPLYAVLAVLVALLAATFSKAIRLVHDITSKLAVPAWVRPGIGGLALGVLAAPVIWYVSDQIGAPGQGMGILGGGYGAAQMAINGSRWLPSGKAAVELLLLLCAGKLVAASLTIGSGGSAGDFAPSLVLGGLLGGAFGRALQLLIHDPTLDPGAFALVGMGTFYGGIAHVPLSAVILTCELAGSYDLLVPLMLAAGIAFLILRHQFLYDAQVPTHADSPVHRKTTYPRLLNTLSVRAVLDPTRGVLTFQPGTPATDIVRRVTEAEGQYAFPVVDPLTSRLVGTITSDAVQLLMACTDMEGLAIAADLMQPPVAVTESDSLRTAAQLMLDNGLHVLPVIDSRERVIGLVGEVDITRAHLDAAVRADSQLSTATPLAV